jgi:hypothetical protein
VLATSPEVKSSNVVPAGDAGELGGEDVSPPGVGLALGDDADAGEVESEVHASDSAEEGEGSHVTPRPKNFAAHY